MHMPGTLYVVATPIGNLGDMTVRALEVLKSVDLIAAEDTRHTGILLAHYGVTKPLTSYFEHNERAKSHALIRRLKEGVSIALVSNAGTPGISDPGYRIISQAITEGIRIVSIPGPSAMLAALAVSGKPTHSFLFEGFLPVKQSQRKKRLRELLSFEATIVVYESVHRIAKTLEDLVDICPEREIVCARELTKKFEEVLRGVPAVLLAHFRAHPPKGEFVLVL
jgi:16S rRNA (cytidine1402-2'-O)-methyltransferase